MDFFKIIYEGVMLKKFLSVLRGVEEPKRPIKQQETAFYQLDESELEPNVPIAVVMDKQVVSVSVPVAKQPEIDVSAKVENSVIWDKFLGQDGAIEYNFDDGLCFDIEYKDSRGNVTTRSIECYGFKQNANSEVMNAHCYVRERMRTFRIDRILTASNGYTGEVYEDLGDWLDQLRLYFKSKQVAQTAKEENKYIEVDDDLDWDEPEDAKAVAKLMRRCEDGLKVLFYFARCDGDYHISEYFVIDEYIEEMNCLDGEDNYLIVETGVIMDWAESLKISFRDAEKALIRLDRKGGLNDILKAVKKVIDADGVLHPKEHEAYLELLG